MDAEALRRRKLRPASRQAFLVAAMHPFAIARIGRRFWRRLSARMPLCTQGRRCRNCPRRCAKALSLPSRLRRPPVSSPVADSVLTLAVDPFRCNDIGVYRASRKPPCWRRRQKGPPAGGAESRSAWMGTEERYVPPCSANSCNSSARVRVPSLARARKNKTLTVE